MKTVVITTGVYGRRTENGRVLPVAKGECVTVSDDEAMRLVSMGVANFIATASGGPTGPLIAPQNGPEPEGMPQDTPGEKAPAEGATNGEKADPDNVDVSRLERIPKGDLERMAQDMGVDISSARNNRERAELIVAAMSNEDGDVPPELEDEDIVR